ncbi:MAG: hypothetical protein J6H31_06265 [Butyrivibrio sp.]|nr:hypothetical protein [Butyrivibrio sp.]
MDDLVNGYVDIPKCSLKKLVNTHGILIGSLYFLLQYDMIKILFLYIFTDIKSKILYMLVLTTFQLVPNPLREWLSLKFMIFNYVPKVSSFWNEMFSCPFIFFKISGGYYVFERSDVRATIIVIFFLAMIMVFLHIVPNLEKEYECFQYDWKEWIKRKISDDCGNDKVEELDISVGDIIKAVLRGMFNKVGVFIVLNVVVVLYALC